ncbi:hypothetical protein pb186bvf_009347 [Paramecium bursaria]
MPLTYIDTSYVYDCLISNQCDWDGSKCSYKTCSDIQLQSLCAEQTGRCAYYDGECQKFPQCDKLVGQSKSQCSQMSNQCTFITGSSCTNFVKLQCSEIPIDECNFDPECIGIDGKCTTITQCSQLDNQSLRCVQANGSCEYKNLKCIPKTCQDSTDECIPISSLDGKQKTLCALQNNVCTEELPEKLGNDQCVFYTNFAYSWNTKLGVCQKCVAYGYILSLIFYMML